MFDFQTFTPRRLWKDVTLNLKIKDIDAATEAKHRLEEKQRAEARERKEKEQQWETRVRISLAYMGMKDFDSSLRHKSLVGCIRKMQSYPLQ